MTSDSQPNPLRASGLEQMAAWTLRLPSTPGLGEALIADPHLFALFYASCASAVDPPSQLTVDAVATTIGEGDTEKVLSTLKELQRQFGSSASGAFARLYLQGLRVHTKLESDADGFIAALEEWRKAADTATSKAITSQEQNLTHLEQLLGLEPIERSLMLFQLNRDAPGFAALFEILLQEEGTSPLILALMFGASPLKVWAALGSGSTLVRSGLLSVQERPLRIHRISPQLAAALSEPADSFDDFIKRFARPLLPSPSTGSLARLTDADRAILLALLRQRVPDDHGINALVWGPRSVDKKDMLARLLSEEGFTAWEVNSKKVAADDLAAWVYIAQRHIEQSGTGGVLVIDRADQALASRSLSILSIFGMSEPEPEEDRASDVGLTDARVPCVWLVDSPTALSERNLGRFLFHAEARPGSRADRRERISQVIEEFALSAEIEQHLARYSLLGEQQVRQAARLADLLEEADSEDVLRRAVEQAQKALGRDQTEELRDSVTKYSLDYLNVGGRFTPQQILDALRKRPRGTLCFYGLPGAGKTQLAEYLAVELDMPILMKRASDLLSKWLGESEQNIASMFQEARSEGAILFLDEADSFLRDRALARAEWSVTQVNELLQQMERHDGIFIAATNLMRDVDAAAMRRFTWKLEFLPMRSGQAWEMFCNETGFKSHLKKNEKRSEELREALSKIKNLTPGDFATVKRQALMLGEELDEEGWLEQLAVEAKAKMKGLERNPMGFGAHD